MPAALAILLAVGAVAAPMAWSFRRRAWVAARPRLVEAYDEQLAAAVRRLLAQVEQPLLDAGFARAAAVYAPEFSGRADWTQVLFVNRATGERASIMGHQDEGSD